MRRQRLRRSVLLAAVLGLTLVVSGCTIFGGGIEIGFSPNPVPVCPDGTVEGTLTIRTRGLGTIHVDSASAMVIGPDGKTLETFEVIEKDIVIPAPFSHTIEDAKITEDAFKVLSQAEEIRLAVSGDYSATYVIHLTDCDSQVM